LIDGSPAARIARWVGPDCNRNGVEDWEDILGHRSQDCNANCVPDECDIASGFSKDCDRNGIPDECEPCTAGLVGEQGGYRPRVGVSPSYERWVTLKRLWVARDGDPLLFRGEGRFTWENSYYEPWTGIKSTEGATHFAKYLEDPVKHKVKHTKKKHRKCGSYEWNQYEDLIYHDYDEGYIWQAPGLNLKFNVSERDWPADARTIYSLGNDPINGVDVAGGCLQEAVYCANEPEYQSHQMGFIRGGQYHNDLPAVVQFDGECAFKLVAAYQALRITDTPDDSTSARQGEDIRDYRFVQRSGASVAMKMAVEPDALLPFDDLGPRTFHMYVDSDGNTATGDPSSPRCGADFDVRLTQTSVNGVVSTTSMIWC